MFSFSYILWHKNKTCYGLALGSFMRFSPSFSGGVISVMSKPDIRTLTWQNQQNTNLHPQWNLVNSVSGSNVAGDTLQLTALQNGWCIVSGFKYWTNTEVSINGISLIIEQNVGDNDAKTSFTHIFPVRKNDTVKITYPANPQKREFSIRLYL